MKRVYHPYWLWEDWKAGMWRKCNAVERKELLEKAIEFTGDHEMYGDQMMVIVKSWPIACEHNLTDSSLNKLAWIGHAATAYAINCPEDITRMAWGCLSEQQRNLANAKAQDALNFWTMNYEKQNSQLCLELEI